MVAFYKIYYFLVLDPRAFQNEDLLSRFERNQMKTFSRSSFKREELKMRFPKSTLIKVLKIYIFSFVILL